MIFFSRPKIYTVHINPDMQNPQENALFVREGFCVKAFLFGPLWTLYHRLWLETLALFIINIVLAEFDKYELLNAPAIGILQLALGIIVGYHAYDWQRAKLARTGYITADISVSDNLLRAQQRYFERAIVAA